MTLMLSKGEIHIWSANLLQPDDIVDQLHGELSEDEKERAREYKYDRDRRRFIVSRGMLRRLLGRYLQEEPSRLVFTYGIHGKPDLRMKFLGQDVLFNLAHSEDLALYAFTTELSIGLDLEYVKEIPDADEVASRFFSDRENAILEVQVGRRRLEAFYRCWTLKEAYVKAMGAGMAFPLRRVEVSFTSGGARLLEVNGDRHEAARWSMFTLEPAEGYVAAVAVNGMNYRFKQYSVDEKFLSG